MKIMTILPLTVLFALLLTQNQVFGQDDYCFGKDTEREQTRHFSSKSAYQIVKGANMDKQYSVPNCVPKKIWILHRHGTRLPTIDVIQKASRLEQIRDEIVKNYRVRKTKPATNALCSEDLIALQMWKWNSSITPDQAEFLTSQGYDDMKGTAKLYQKFYPDVLNKMYNNTTYLFSHTDKQRTRESFKAFAEGLFGESNSAESTQLAEADMLLRPYDSCESWKKHDYNGPNSETRKFRSSELWNKTLSDISKRLGFNYKLEEDDVLLMYDICRYEQAWHVDRTSNWCATFTPEQIYVLEYNEDLKYYYKSGYGYEENKHLSCHAVKDMLTHLESDKLPNVVTYFSHSGALQTLITTLGIAKDATPLTATNYKSQVDRRWKSSLIDPFAANFLAVKFQCNDDPINKEKVLFFLNQNGVDLTWCNVGLCNWADVMNRYKDIHKADCDSYYCRSDATAFAASLISVLLALIHLF